MGRNGVRHFLLHDRLSTGFPQWSFHTAPSGGLANAVRPFRTIFAVFGVPNVPELQVHHGHILLV